MKISIVLFINDSEIIMTLNQAGPEPEPENGANGKVFSLLEKNISFFLR